MIVHNFEEHQIHQRFKNDTQRRIIYYITQINNS